MHTQQVNPDRQISHKFESPSKKNSWQENISFYLDKISMEYALEEYLYLGRRIHYLNTEDQEVSEVKESWQCCALRIVSLVIGYIPAKLINMAIKPSRLTPTVCHDFLDVLNHWEKGEKVIESYSNRNNPSWIIYADFNRGSYIFREGRKVENHTYLQNCFKHTLLFPEHLLQNKKYYYRPIFRYQYKYEYLREYFIQNGFNSTDGALLDLKAMFLCTQAIGMSGFTRQALRIALEKNKFQFDPPFEMLHKKNEDGYPAVLMWRADFIEVIDKTPYLVLKAANFLPREGAWVGLNKNLKQSRYFIATAKFDLRETIVRGREYGEKENKSKNFEKLEWNIDEFTDVDSLDFYSEDEKSAILEGVGRCIGNWIDWLVAYKKLTHKQVSRSWHFQSTKNLQK